MCKGNSRDYKPILLRLAELGYPRNYSMRDQVPVLYASIQNTLNLEVEVKTTDLTMGPVSSMRVNYVIELFGDGPDGHSLVRQIGKDSLRDALIQALSTSTLERLGEEHLHLEPAVFKTLHHVAIDLCWKCPTTVNLPATRVDSGGKSRDARSDRGDRRSKQSQASNKARHMEKQNTDKHSSDGPPEIPLEGRLEFANHLDGVCVVFEEQSLREVVDYSGPHGVRLVANGVVDYRGVWAGKVGVGDATGGAVCYSGEAIDNAAFSGRNTFLVRFDKIPRNATDLFLALTTPTSFDIAEFSELHVILRDAENPGHEIAAAHIGSVGRGEAAVLSVISRDSTDHWNLSAFGCTCLGTARDYRPALLCLRAIQEQRHARMPQWPHQVRDQQGRPVREKMSLRLPDIGRSSLAPPSVQNQRRASAISAIASFVNTLPDDVPAEDTQYTPGTASPSMTSSRISRAQTGSGILVNNRSHDSPPWSA